MLVIADDLETNVAGQADNKPEFDETSKVARFAPGCRELLDGLAQAFHEFAGALLGKQGDRGVFITTSRFTTGARQEAERINARIELIDGARLARLLVDYGVGVQGEQTVTLYRIDEDFFDGL